MRPFKELEAEKIKDVRLFFTDVDDTITTEGKLFPEALGALWQLSRRGVPIILVTGGSAGWADVYIRQWPVDAVIAESGALVFYREGEKPYTFIHPSLQGIDLQHRRTDLMNRIKKEIPAAQISSDQFCRLYDVAFDHTHVCGRQKEEMISRIVHICTEEGASCGVSSIHINCWFGEYDKLNMVKLFSQKQYGIERSNIGAQVIYCGDAPNDIPLFRALPLSVGVGSAAFRSWKPEDRPAYSVEESGGKGFLRVTELFIQKQDQPSVNV
ncbi:MAG: HAD-IIB family hydrolase [Spirochaetota bacterium]